MGRIKTRLVKSVAAQLLEKNVDGLTKDFDKNKLIVNERTTVSSKKLRNSIAGMITRRMKAN